MEKKVQLRRGELGSEEKKEEFVPKEAYNKRKIEGKDMKCKRSNHLVRNCKVPSVAKIPLFYSNANQEPVWKKRRFNIGPCKIMEIGSKEDLVNE